MLSGLAQRVGSPWAVIGLGLATPLLAVGALALANGGASDHEVVTAASDRAPTLMPLGPTPTTMYVLEPDEEPVTTSGGEPRSASGESSKTSTTKLKSSRSGSASRSSKSSKATSRSSKSKSKSK